MNQEKIGKFIAQNRKDKKMTQQELGEKLGVTDKTISRWENGNYMPDLSLLKPLSKELGISINELLSGARINKEDYQDKFEENVLNTIDYSTEEIKKNRINTLIIGVGIGILVFSLLFVNSTGTTMWGTIMSLLIMSFGIYRLRKNYKIITCIIFFISALGILLLMDYSNVMNNKAPIFTYLIETGSDAIVYKTPFYNVNRCNVDTASQYYEVDFSRDKEVCTNLFDPNKSEISRLLKYKNKYLGNNSNTGNLYYSLPLSQYGFNFELDSTNLGIIINYSNSEFYINEDNNDELFVKKSLIYNAISTFILIDNTEYIIYNFSGISYKINKKDVISKYDSFDKLIINDKINESSFNKYVTDKIKDADFVNNNFNSLLQAQ
ncbi:MAG: helix-turn-helix domain-containing protein [Bacilli bacterium]|nr:helix-turn-helix domain-containing protein [Bacilli bacterium]